MIQLKVITLQIVINVVIAFIMIKAFIIGVSLEKEIWGWDYWFVTIVIGAIVSAAAYKILSVVKNFVSFSLKAAHIYSITAEEDSLLKCLGFVTLDFKEVVEVATLNVAIRKLMKSLTDKMYDATEEIEFLQRFKRLSFINNLSNSPIVSIAKKLTLKTFDYADECILAYCYVKDDALLTDCFKGFCQFIKHAIKTSAIIGSHMVISTIIKIAIVIGYVWYYLGHFTLSPISVVSAYIILITILFIWEDAIYETLCCYSTVRSFIQEVDVEEEPDSEIQSALEAIVDVTELKAVIDRFGGKSKERKNDNVEEGTSSGDSDGSDVSEGMDSGIQ